MELIARCGCGVSLIGDIRKLSGHSPGQTALDDAAWTGIWTRRPLEVPSSLKHSVILQINGNKVTNLMLTDTCLTV